ncbi:MAG TPA: thioesterase family protein [Streptosporangiaceae bacterium]|jgi:acyl-CoA thioester hydrolase
MPTHGAAPGPAPGERPPERPAGFPVLRTAPTRWSDNDVYGHVNNVVYYSLFDTTVNGWLLEACGTDIRDLPAIGVVAETSCRFLRSTSFPDVLHVGLGLERRGRTSVVYRLAVFGTTDGHIDDEPAALGRFVHVYVDRGTRRPAPIPEPVAKALDALAPDR